MCLIFNGEFIHKHCLTGILLIKACMVCPQTINVLFDVTGLPTENVPRELVTCFREVLDNGETIHAKPYGEPGPSPSPWPEQHKVGVGVILPYSYIIRHLLSTYDQKLCLLRRTVY